MGKRNLKYNFCLPEKVLNTIPELVALQPGITGFSESRMKYLLSTITTHRQDKHPGSYSVLYMPFLKNVVPNADKYLNFLKDMGVIEWKNHFAGRNSRLYRITKQYESPVIFRTITDAYLIRRIEKSVNQVKRTNSKKYPHLNRFTYMVNINYEQAMQTIERTYQGNKNHDTVKAESRRTFSIAEVLKIQAGQVYIKVNNTNGRYDTNFTRLPGELVPHLTINNKPLVELDIKNSQPFFATALFNPCYELKSIIGHSLTMFAKTLQLHDKQDVKLYALLVRYGEFYDFMSDQFSKNSIHYTGRDNIKEQLFTVFFGKNQTYHFSPAVKLFASKFPNVWHLFSAIKKHDHARLAILLQRIESFVMLEKVAPAIIEQFPGVEFITKHDSLLPGILVTDEVEPIKKIMINEIKKAVGHAPKIEVKGAKNYTRRVRTLLPIYLSQYNTPLPLFITKPYNELINRESTKVDLLRFAKKIEQKKVELTA